MKTCFFLPLIVLTLCGCKSPYFNYIPDIDLQKKYDEYIIDPGGFQLYVKSICIDSLGQPVSCPGVKGEKVVEMEYLLLSEKDKRVLVINNLANRSQKFFEDPSRLMKLNNDDTGVINIWFFKQFRFGLIEDDPTLVTGQHLTFTTIEKHPVTYVWQYTKIDECVTLVAVGERYPDRIDNRISQASLSLVPTFKRVENFKFVFQIPKQFSRGDPIPVELPQAKWRVLRNGKRDMAIYFLFDSPIFENNKVVQFNGNRMYSYYGEKKR